MSGEIKDAVITDAGRIDQMPVKGAKNGIPRCRFVFQHQNVLRSKPLAVNQQFPEGPYVIDGPLEILPMPPAWRDPQFSSSLRFHHVPINADQ